MPPFIRWGSVPKYVRRFYQKYIYKEMCSTYLIEDTYLFWSYGLYFNMFMSFYKNISLSTIQKMLLQICTPLANMVNISLTLNHCASLQQKPNCRCIFTLYTYLQQNLIPEQYWNLTIWQGHVSIYTQHKCGYKATHANW